MALLRIRSVTGTGVCVPGDDIDTDRIIPARFLRCVTFDGLGENLFRDERFGPGGEKLGHPLDDPRRGGATILVSGRNFGCGSSREHAPQAIAKSGIKAIVAESFAEIFFGNATTLGIPCVSLPRGDLSTVGQRVEADPAVPLTIDLDQEVVRVGDDLVFGLSMKPAAREALVSGSWDPIAQLLEGKDQVLGLARSLPYLDLPGRP